VYFLKEQKKENKKFTVPSSFSVGFNCYHHFLYPFVPEYLLFPFHHFIHISDFKGI